ncbi:MAG: tRNA (adenosine(37)-N6)-threonylcarbamoyltransferase complex ATPase subunit type 1 TsaE [Eubacteriales bacterium]|nr:tRNA (adenosine(37)-N6)-threonylcarbamoyltransferase complex ATPase subunit type 1 TsaE [Eubacteriales bacterium]
MIELRTHNAKETRMLGERLARQLRAGDVLLLQGDLGAGKSELTRGIACGLGIEGNIPSPSFTILQVYENGRLPLFHFDWYRLGGAEELYEMAMDEYLYDDGVAVVEWPEKAVEAIPETHLRVTIESLGDNDRKFTLAPAGAFHPLEADALEGRV